MIFCREERDICRLYCVLCNVCTVHQMSDVLLAQVQDVPILTQFYFHPTSLNSSQLIVNPYTTSIKL